MRVAVIGGVNSTELLVRKLKEHGFEDLHVFGYAPADTRLVSGWSDLRAVCQELDLPYTPFVKVTSCEDSLRAFAPDVVFAVGLSQLLPRSLMSIPRLETIGFHPTKLPQGRGRAALAWIVLDGCPGAATFFGIREGVDDGPIYVQRPFPVTEDDDAAAVERKMLAAQAAALDEWLPDLREGKLDGREQDHSQASWYARRTPLDGWIDWSRPAEDVLKLIRASTHPHPGAITVADDVRLTIWEARPDARPERGVVGRLVRTTESGFSVQTGTGLIEVSRWDAEGDWQPRVGAKLGYYPEAEILRLRQRCSELERRLQAVEEKLGGVDA